MQKTLSCLLVLVFASVAVLRKVEADSRGDHLGSDHQQRSSSRRVKRDSLSEAEMREVTDIHNHVRSLEGASDMQTLVGSVS